MERKIPLWIFFLGTCKCSILGYSIIYWFLLETKAKTSRLRDILETKLWQMFSKRILSIDKNVQSSGNITNSDLLEFLNSNSHSSDILLSDICDLGHLRTLSYSWVWFDRSTKSKFKSQGKGLTSLVKIPDGWGIFRKFRNKKKRKKWLKFRRYWKIVW